MKRRCVKCRQSKSLDDFYDGWTACKDCDADRRTAHRRCTAKDPILGALYRERQREYRRQCDARFPNKVKARRAVAYLVRKGRIPSPSELNCARCKSEGRGLVRASLYHHHKGYDPPHHLDVISLCDVCDRDTRRSGEMKGNGKGPRGKRLADIARERGLM